MDDKIKEFEQRCWRLFNAVVRLLDEDPDIEVEMERTSLNPDKGLAQVSMYFGQRRYLSNFDARCNYADLLDVDRGLRVAKWELKSLALVKGKEWLVAELKKKLQPRNTEHTKRDVAMTDALPLRVTVRIEGASTTSVDEATVINGPDVVRGISLFESAITLRVWLGDALVDAHLSADDASDLAKALRQAARRSESTLRKFLHSPWGKFFVGLEHLIDHDPDLAIGDGDPLSKVGSSQFGLDGSADLTFSFQGDECGLTFDPGQARLYRSGEEIRSWSWAVPAPPPDVAEWFKELKEAVLAE